MRVVVNVRKPIRSRSGSKHSDHVKRRHLYGALKVLALHGVMTSGTLGAYALIYELYEPKHRVTLRGLRSYGSRMGNILCGLELAKSRKTMLGSRIQGQEYDITTGGQQWLCEFENYCRKGNYDIHTLLTTRHA